MEPLKLRVWHIPNVPGVPFHVPVSTVSDAMAVLRVLSEYDLYLDELIQNNAQGLEVFENGEWSEYHDDDGYDVCALMHMRIGC